jgi:hypothetical protein
MTKRRSRNERRIAFFGGAPVQTTPLIYAEDS